MSDEHAPDGPDHDGPDHDRPDLDGPDLDGNALAGGLAEIFAVDLTAAVGWCAACGREDPVAVLRVYARGPGQVARCAGCDAVVLRLSRTPGAAWLDLSGTSRLRIALTD